MNSTKFTQVHVYIIGGVLMLLLGVGLFFALIKPLNDQNKLLADQIGATEGTQVSIGDQSLTIMPTWQTRKQEAEEKLQQLKQSQAQKAAELASLENRKQLPPARRIDIGDGTEPHLLRVTMPRWLNLPQYVVQMMTSYARSTGARRGVTVQTQFKAPAPTTDPRQIEKRIIAWPLGTVTATGEFNDVMQWAEDWNRAPLLVAVDGLKCSLAGRGGRVTATANITAYVFPTGQAVTNAPAAGDPGAAAGGMPGGGMPGGYPGGGGMPGGYPGTGGPPGGYPSGG